jgi:hypothetical protein
MGLNAVRRAGIESGRDLLQFDHRQFWQERLLLFAVDKKRLGRMISNHLEGRKRRTSRIARVEDHYRIELIDQWGASIRIQRALVPISNEVPLPP